MKPFSWISSKARLTRSSLEYSSRLITFTPLISRSRSELTSSLTSFINSGEVLKLIFFTPTVRYAILSSSCCISVGFSSSNPRDNEKVPNPSRLTLYPIANIRANMLHISVKAASIALVGNALLYHFIFFINSSVDSVR